MRFGKRYNSMAFTPEEVEKGKHLELIKFLVSCGDDKSFEEIHIITDGYCTIVEWYSNYYDDRIEYFPFVDEDQEIMTIVDYPDNTTGYAKDDEEAKQMFDEWVREHPTYKQNEWGVWYDESQNLDSYCKSCDVLTEPEGSSEFMSEPENEVK